MYNPALIKILCVNAIQYLFLFRYKQRCDEMRRQYEQRLANFYEDHPTLRPVKPEKAKKALVNIYVTIITIKII